MKRILKVLVLLVIMASLFSCASLNVPVAATSNAVGPYVGQSRGTIWLGLIGNVDAGIQAAAQNGRITEISTVDFEQKIILFGLGMRYTCTVTGK